jgi:hypothetical protein
MLDGEGPITIFMLFLLTLIIIGVFTGAICFGVWLSNRQGQEETVTPSGIAGPVAGQIVTIINGSATGVRSLVDSFIDTVRTEAPAGTIFTTYVSLDMRYKT